MTAQDTAPALIVGGGIGGLTAALALAQAGVPVRVSEQAEHPREIGAGIQLSPNCTRVLHHLGLEDALRAVAFVPEQTEMRHWRHGRVLSSNPLGERVIDRFGYPYYHVHRADLLAVLAEAVRASGDIELHMGESCEHFIDHGDRVDLQLEQQSVGGRLLVGADGIHSAVRATLFGTQAPRFTGNVAWRALVPAERLPPGLVKPGTTVWMGPGKHFVHYYVRRGELVNCVCVVEKQGWEVESWTERGELTELQRDFAGWHPDVRSLIDHMDPQACYKWALFDREPMTQWGRGRVTLLGDACHPTLPFLAQGAAMAIEDAVVLARCVAARPDDVDTALRRYAELRQARTAGIQQGSRRNARVFHLRGAAAWLRNRALSRARAGVLDRIYSYDALSVVPD